MGPVLQFRRFRRAASLLIALALFLVEASAGHRSASAQQPAPSDDPLRELAVRLLTPVGVGPFTVNTPPARLVPSALPPNLPLEPPLPPNARVIGSVVRASLSPPYGPQVTPTVTDGFEIVLDVPASPSDVLTFYQGALTARGLSVPPVGAIFRPGGFQPSFGPPVSQATYCRSENGPFIQIMAFGRDGQPTDVRLHIETFSGPCAVPRGAPSGPPPSSPIPPLDPPTGVTVIPSGGGGSQFLQSSDAVATTSLSVSELESQYARQLVAAGWTRSAGGADGPLAWSTWRVTAAASRPGDTPAAGAQQGFLAVLEGPAADQRTLHIQVTTPAEDDGTRSTGAVIGSP